MIELALRQLLGEGSYAVLTLTLKTKLFCLTEKPLMSGLVQELGWHPETSDLQFPASLHTSTSLHSLPVRLDAMGSADASCSLV